MHSRTWLDWMLNYYNINFHSTYMGAKEPNPSQINKFFCLSFQLFSKLALLIYKVFLYCLSLGSPLRSTTIDLWFNSWLDSPWSHLSFLNLLCYFFLDWDALTKISKSWSSFGLLMMYGYRFKNRLLTEVSWLKEVEIYDKCKKLIYQFFYFQDQSNWKSMIKRYSGRDFSFISSRRPSRTLERSPETPSFVQ